MGFFCCRSGYAFAPLPHTPPPRAYFCEIRRARRAMGSLTRRAYARRFFCCRQRQSLETSNKTALSPRTNPNASRKRPPFADTPPSPMGFFCCRSGYAFAALPAYASAARLFLRNTARPPSYGLADAARIRAALLLLPTNSPIHQSRQLNPYPPKLKA